MSPMIAVRQLGCVALLLGVALLGCAATALADPKPLPKGEQAKVDQAVEKGVAYLKRTQTKEGYWAAKPFQDRYWAGQAALCAYALLEAGAAADDPAVQEAATFVRRSIIKVPKTYEVSLAVLFLDRLGDPKDKPLIQSLALRLIAGQFWTGGWSYDCPPLKAEQETAFLKLLEKLSKGLEPGKPYAEVLAELDVPSDFKRWAVFQDPEKLRWREVDSPAGVKKSVPFVGVTDNSNTQFAILGLWAARRHGIPTGPTFRLMVERFERGQAADGGWSYGFGGQSPIKFAVRRDGNGPPWRSMTCTGLLALAVGRGVKLPTPGSIVNGAEDLRILGGLAALYRGIGRPKGSMEDILSFEDVYFLWFLERVGMLYSLPTIGDKDWYRWGAEILVTNQNRRGSWPGVVPQPDSRVLPRFDYGQVLSTAFALLFLKHSHPMRDLTPKLPFTPKELNEGIMRLNQAEKEPPPTAAPSRGGPMPDL